MRIDDRNDAPALARTHSDAGAATSWRPSSMKIRDKLACPKAKFRGSAASDRKLLAIDSRPDAFRQRLHHANSAKLLIGISGIFISVGEVLGQYHINIKR